MGVNCLSCGDEIDTGHYKDDDEKENELDTFDKGDFHMTIGVRRGFRQSGGLGRLHTECFEDEFDVEFEPPNWGE